MSDKETSIEISNMTPRIKLNMKWYINLNKYSSKSRSEMEKEGIWSEFQMMKAKVIEKALEEEEDTLFLDSDMVILDEINDINKDKSLGVSPQFIQEKNVKEVGYYNGGMLWTNKKHLPEDWIEFTKTSRYFDQASIEDLVKKYDYFEFGENYNLQSWRFILGLEHSHIIMNNINVKNGRLYYKDKRLKTIHTHFNARNELFKSINYLLLNKLKSCKSYKELCCINRGITGCWEIHIPKQPKLGLWSHKNDSFRELGVMWNLKHEDVRVIMDERMGNCMLFPEIFLYDRPTLEWVNQRLTSSNLLMLGNGDVMKEGKYMETEYGVKVKPWIFWPRRPMIIESYLKREKPKTYEERKNKITFIGNIENLVQNKYRKSKIWETFVDNYHCTEGLIHKFTQEEYLEELHKSKYGLCLRGYGRKCHREVELMSLGTVPIITEEVTVTSYINPLIENIHYVKLTNVEEWKEPLKEEWERMSKECINWYKENVHSDNSWNLTITNILYT
ncbi:MAG: hypothetical protein CXT73_04835 [Methanobacteriota archaeon]|nr:MAG: hypothetical protein CXT73_04835 [Euryarchaeota archaeon]